jgi:putative phage-type endonuclease
MIEQGTPEWHALRLGKATASRIADIVRKTKSGPSASRERYLGELVAERLTGATAASFKSADMDWGNEKEADAKAAYAFLVRSDLEAIAFVDHPSIDMSGASPDGLVGDSGLIEIKCPATHTHIATLLSQAIDADYITQMQWQMACTGRHWCDFVSFDPRMPHDMQVFIKRVERDAARIAELEAEVSKFLLSVDDTLAKLVAMYRSKEAAE